MAVKRKKYLDMLNELRSQENLSVVAVNDKPVKQTPKTGKVTLPTQALNARTMERAATNVAKETTTTTKAKKEEDKSWWQEFFKGSDAFDDGYDFGDITKTTLSSATDLILGTAKGITGVVEGVTDLAQYGVGEAFDLFGADETAEKIKNSAKKSWTNAIFDEPMSFYDKNSIFGDTTDAVAQGVGQGLTYIATGSWLGKAGNIAVNIGKHVLNIPTMALLSGAGSGITEAYNKGDVEDWQAWTKGLGSGAIEGFAEGLFGMFGVGGSSLDDALSNTVTRAMKTGFSKAAAKVGIKAIGEGVEEQISYSLNYALDHGIDIISQMTGNTNVKFGEEWSNEQFWEDFFVGTLSATVLQGGGTTINVTQAQSNAIAEAEKQLGRTLTSQEKSDLKKQISLQLMQAEENDITMDEQKVVNSIVDTRTADQALTDAELRKIRQQVVSDLKKGYVSTQDIENALLANENMEITSLQERLATEADPKAKADIETLIDLNQITKQTKLDNLLNENQLLQESYRESQRSTQRYDYMASNEDSSFKKALNEDAKAILDNSNRSHDFVETLTKIAEDRNTSYRLVNNEKLKEMGYAIEGKTVNGLVTEKGEVLINVDSKKALNAILGHETTHLLEDTEEYEQLQQFAIAYAKTKGEYDARLQNLNKLYQGTKANVYTELTSDIIGDYLFTDEQFINDLSTKQPNVFQKVYNYIKHLYKMATAGSTEARQLEELKYNFDKAYKAMNTQKSTDTRYSLLSKEAYEGRQKYVDRRNALNEENAVNVTEKQHEIIQKIAKMRHEIHVSEGLYNTESSDYSEQSEFLSKINEELIENGLPPIEWTVNIDMLPGDYDVAYGIATDEDANFEEFLRQKEQINTDIERYLTKFDKEHNTKYAPTGATRYSLTDNQGNELKPAVQKWAEKSKARDENGNLKILYHGTATGEFYSFDKNMANVEADWGAGFYLTDSEYDVETNYEDGGADFENRVAMLAEQIEQEEDLAYEEAEEKAREQLYKGGYRIAAYVNIENPAIVGKTYIFSPEDYLDEHNMEDYDSEEDYYGDVEQLVADDIDKAVWEVEQQYELWNSEELASVLWEAYNEGGIEIQDFKNRLNELEFIDDEGRLVNSDIARITLESLGYDGIIDSTVSTKWNMSMETGTTHYIAFKPNQIKSVTNESPTESDDIRYSLSEDTQETRLAKLNEDFDLYDRTREDLYDRRNAVEEQYNAIVNSEDYKNALKKVTSMPDANEATKTEEYELLVKAQRLKNQINDYQDEIDIAYKEMSRIAKEIDKEEKVHRNPNETIKQAKKKLGLTNNFKEAGYMLEDGSLLDFSGRSQGSNAYNQRMIDHREINEFGYEMEEFIELGNIRLQPESNGFEMMKEPTPKQYNMLKKYIDSANGEVFIDIYKNNNMALYDSAEYRKGTPTRKIINDLKEYFRTGSFPKQSELAQFRYSLSRKNEHIAPTGSYNVYGEDIKFQVEEAIAPLKEQISQLTEQLEKNVAEDIKVPEIENTDEIAPIEADSTLIQELRQTELPTVEEMTELENTRLNKSGSEYASAFYNLQRKYGTTTLYEALNEFNSANKNNRAAELPNSDKLSNVADQAIVEQQGEQNFQSLTDADIAPTLEDTTPEATEDAVKLESPFDNRDIQEVSNRSVKAYMYENPEVKPFFQAEAQNMLNDLRNSIKGERSYNDQLYYETSGEQGWYGTTRQTTEDIAYLLDNFNYSYKQIEEGLNKIIHDDGLENNAVSKRIEFMLDERLKNGYADVAGYPIPANQEYINLLEEKAITEYHSNRFANMSDEELLQIAQGANAETFVQQATPDMPKIQKGVKTVAREQYEAIEPRDSHGYSMKRIKTDAELQAEKHKEIAKILVDEPATVNNKNKRKAAIIMANTLDKGLVFENLALKKGNRELQGKWDYTLTSEARAQHVIGNGHTRRGAKKTKSLNEIRERVERAGYTQPFYDYMYHRLNVDRMTLEERFARKNKPVFGDSVTAEQSEEVARQYEAAFPEFMEWAEDVYNYVNADRQQLVDNGIISQETADYWSNMYPHYVPIRRVGHTGNAINVPLDTGRTGVNAPIKKATGGSSDILPLFDTIAMRTLQTYRATAKNSFGVELMHTMDPMTERRKADIDEVIDSIEAQEELLQEGKNGQNPTFTVFEDGERITFDITEDMYDALKPLSDSSLLSKTFKPLNVASNIRRGLLTEYNPIFMLTNGIKDVQDVLINSQHAAKTYAKIPEAYAQILRKGYWYQEYMENGGQQNSYFDSQENKFDTEQKGITNMFPLRAISSLNNFIEMAPRLAEYIASREAGRSIETSMLDAARVTTNFKAGGALTKFINRNGGTFLNASVQGAMQQVRNIREANANGLKGWANLVTKYALAGIPAMLLNSLLWGDDDEYEELSDYVKQNYYVVAKNEDGTFIRIPKGRTVAVIQEALNQMGNLVTGDDEADLSSFLSLLITNLAPNNPIDNNIFSPLIQAGTNTAWYGGDLVPTRLQDLPAAEQYDESTDEFSKWLGELINVSPYKINYVIDQYSGGIGDLILPMLTPEAENGSDSILGNLLAPLNDKFTTNSTLNNQNVTDFYDLSDELTTGAKKSKATDEDILMNKYINSVKGEMSKLYEEKRNIQNSDLPDSEKYQQVLDIQRQINELAKEALGDYEDVTVTESYSKVDDLEYYKNNDGEWTKVREKEATELNNLSMTTDDKTNYFTAKNKISEISETLEAEERKIQIIETVLDSGLSEDQMAYLYDKYYASTEKLDIVVKSGIGMSNYLDLEAQGFTADKDEDGKSISGSKKEKIFEYINSSDMDFIHKVILAKMYYPSYDEYNQEIIDFLNENDDISYEEMEEILKTLNFEVDADGNIYWD